MGGLVEKTTVSGGWTLLVIRYFALFGQENYRDTTHKTELIKVYFFFYNCDWDFFTLVRELLKESVLPGE